MNIKNKKISDSISDFEKMMTSSKMTDFTVACDNLLKIDNPSTFEILKSYINDKDKFKRLYILKKIFDSKYAKQSNEELKAFLEKSISSDDIFFIRQGLRIVAEKNIYVSEELLFSVIQKHQNHLYDEIYALKVVDETNTNFNKIINFFKGSEKSSQKEFVADILINKFEKNYSEELFLLFSNDEFPKIRCSAVKLAKKYGYDITRFQSDVNGHVRKLAQNHN